MSDEAAEDLTSILTRKLLQRLAGHRSFERGEVYFDDGAVRSLRRQGSRIRAVVRGTHDYHVHLWVEDGEIGYDCDCPVGLEGDFCKHCVAAGLAWLDVESDSDASSKAESDLQTYLARLDRETLVSMLLEQAEEDERLYRRLTVRAAASSTGGPNLSVWKQAFDEATSTDHFIHYREAHTFASRIDDVIDSLEEMLRAGQAASVIELAEHGLDKLEQSLGHIDDSDGGMGSLMNRLQALHLEACRIAKPDPEALAARLFEWEMETAHDVFYGAAEVYADVLGERGLATYRRLAEEEWAKMPALGPEDKDAEHYGRRYSITAIMAGFARASDDLEALVAINSRDLSSPYAFLQIAELYRDAGDRASALDWAERGWQAFADGQRDGRLRDFIVEAYQDQGRHDEAMALAWPHFAENPSLHSYRYLEERARQAGQWSHWREQALSLAHSRIAEKQAKPAGRWSWLEAARKDHSLLVEIALHDGEPEEAWRQAESGDCSEGLWLKLAKLREESHPADAVRVYKNRIASLLRNTGNSLYEEAIEMLEKIEPLLDRSGQQAAFQSLLTDIRIMHKRKRNLMKLLDQQGW